MSEKQAPSDTPFGEHGLTVMPGVPGQEWSLAMRLAAFGQEGALAPAGPAEVVAEGRRIELRRAGLTEWYLNEPRGLEQGFTIDRPEGYDPARSVVLSFALDAELGTSVCVLGNAALIGAPHDSVGGTISGSTYVFVRAGTAWLESAKLTASDGALDDYFAVSVSASGETALVGAYADDDGGNSLSGSAYVYRFECGFGAGIAPARWTMIGIPCDLGISNTVA